MCQCYEEADYQAEMGAAAQAEAEAQHEMEYQYDCYLDDLLANGKFMIYGLEKCIGVLSSTEFKNSTMTPVEFLIYKRNNLLNNTPLEVNTYNPKPKPDTELPF